jgi:hypothetical protein
VVETNFVFLKDFAACSSHGRYFRLKIGECPQNFNSSF